MRSRPSTGCFLLRHRPRRTVRCHRATVGIRPGRPHLGGAALRLGRGCGTRRIRAVSGRIMRRRHAFRRRPSPGRTLVYTGGSGRASAHTMVVRPRPTPHRIRRTGTGMHHRCAVPRGRIGTRRIDMHIRDCAVVPEVVQLSDIAQIHSRRIQLPERRVLEMAVCEVVIDRRDTTGDPARTEHAPVDVRVLQVVHGGTQATVRKVGGELPTHHAAESRRRVDQSRSGTDAGAGQIGTPLRGDVPGLVPKGVAELAPQCLTESAARGATDTGRECGEAQLIPVETVAMPLPDLKFLDRELLQRPQSRIQQHMPENEPHQRILGQPAGPPRHRGEHASQHHSHRDPGGDDDPCLCGRCRRRENPYRGDIGGGDHQRRIEHQLGVLDLGATTVDGVTDLVEVSGQRLQRILAGAHAVERVAHLPAPLAGRIRRQGGGLRLVHQGQHGA